ncbi:Tubulin binding cofactor C-like domain [Trypanosoma melophagium]|uniref:Tubulin binding cofactor C-like domain n=1 Tax=Trypanosoma melophagium TaxID=715481 RepID=UPI00351A9117|nr:Tubulin binding cofactor C-like domain [Trypanosoma melophagium]
MLYEAACLPQHKVSLRLPGEVNGQRITIYENKYCNIFVIDHCDSVSVHECENCFIFIGPTSGSVFIDRCRNFVIVCCCAQLRLRECQRLELSLSFATMPVLEHSSGIGACSLSGWFVYPLIPLHMRRARLSLFNNFYTTPHDFTPKSTTSVVGNKSNLYCIDQQDFDKVFWLRWSRLSAARLQLGPWVVHVSVADIALTLEVEPKGIPGEGFCRDRKGRPVTQSVLTSLPVLLINNEERHEQLQEEEKEEEYQREKIYVKKEGGEDKKELSSVTVLGELPMTAEDLFDMFHQMMVIPYTLGFQKLPPTVNLKQWRPRLFAVTSNFGGTAIATRVVQDIELSRRPAFISRAQDSMEKQEIDNEWADVDGAIPLLNSFELVCTEVRVRGYIASVLRSIITSSSSSSHRGEKCVDKTSSISSIMRRMTRRAYIFLLALLKSAAELDDVVEEAQHLFMPLMPTSISSGNNCNYTHKNSNSDSSNIDENASGSRSPSPRYSSDGSVENAVGWEKSLLLNETFPMQDINAIQNTIFMLAPMSDSGVVSAPG